MSKNIIIFILTWLGVLATAHAQILNSQYFDSLNACTTAKNNNQTLYPEYYRSWCIYENWKYYYKICNSKSECSKANENTFKTNQNTKNHTSTNTNLISCNTNQQYKYITDNIKSKLDKVLEKIDTQVKNDTNIVKWYLYGFYDYLFSKVGKSPKYKDSPVIQEVINYLSSKLECRVKYYINNTNNKNEAIIDEFIADISGEKDTKGNTKSREEQLKEVVSKLEEKKVNPDIINNYITKYKLILPNDRKIMQQYIKELKGKKEYKLILLPKYNNLPLWINWNYAKDYCINKYGTNITAAYVINIPLSYAESLKDSYFYYLTKKNWQLIPVKSPKKLWNPKLMNYVTIAVICGKNYSEKEVKDIAEKIKEKIIQKLNNNSQRNNSNSSNTTPSERKKIGTYYCSDCNNINWTYIRTNWNLRDWHRRDYLNVDKNRKYRKVVANRKNRTIYVKERLNPTKTTKNCKYVTKRTNRRWIKTNIKSNYCWSDARQKHEWISLKPNQTIVNCGVYTCWDSLCRKFEVVDKVQVKECK